MDIRIPADFEPHAHTIMAPAVHRELGADREGDGADHAVADDEPVILLTPPELPPN